MGSNNRDVTIRIDGRDLTRAVVGHTLEQASRGPMTLVGGSLSQTEKETVCEEAQRLVGGARQEHYGPPVENFQRIADMWNGYLGKDLLKPINVQDVCAMMICLKQARMRTGGSYHRDSAVDTVGYAYLQEILHDA